MLADYLTDDYKSKVRFDFQESFDVYPAQFRKLPFYVNFLAGKHEIEIRINMKEFGDFALTNPGAADTAISIIANGFLDHAEKAGVIKDAPIDRKIFIQRMKDIFFAKKPTESNIAANGANTKL
ncbi:MAG: hypothetical protein HOA17_09415 [Candidatus Melainabacteria bacterium]|nr:hypothetical protein [Candidatus Melainabacteria bacterium]